MTTELKLDRTDRAILSALLDDGRISNAHPADRVGLSQSPCWHRFADLRKPA